MLIIYFILFSADSKTSNMSTASEQARLRRERRLNKIKQGGASRINQILGQNSDDSQSDVRATASEEAVHSETATPVTPMSSGFMEKRDDTFNADQVEYLPSQDYHNLESSPFKLQCDSPYNVPPENMFNQNPDFANFFQAMLQSAKEGSDTNFQGENEQIPQATAPLKNLVEKYAHLLAISIVVIVCYFKHLVSPHLPFLKLFFCILIYLFQPLLPWTFTVEACLFSIQFVLDRNNGPSYSLLASLASQLPPPYGAMIRHTTSYVPYFTQLITDACMTIFALGLCCYFYPSLVY